MTKENLESALADITSETDPTLKHLKLASLGSAVFAERGVELVVLPSSSTPKALIRQAPLTCA
jgi:hypothetical protein